jgi:hypothetical protein
VRDESNEPSEREEARAQVESLDVDLPRLSVTASAVTPGARTPLTDEDVAIWLDGYWLPTARLREGIRIDPGTYDLAVLACDHPRRSERVVVAPRSNVTVEARLGRIEE